LKKYLIGIPIVLVLTWAIGLQVLSGQTTHIFCALDQNCTWTGIQTFAKVFVQALENVQYVDSSLSRGGIDIGDEINKAYASCPSLGCRIKIAAGSYNFSTTITVGVNNKPALLEGDPAGPVTLNFIPTSSTAIQLDWGTSHLGAAGIRDVALTGPGSGTGSGIAIGPGNGLDQAVLSGVNVSGFPGGQCLNFNKAFNITIETSQLHGCLNGANHLGGEELIRYVNDDIFQNLNYGLNVPVNSTDIWMAGVSCDDNTSGCINNGTSTFQINGGHFENISGTATATYIVNAGGSINIANSKMADDITSGTITAFILNQGGLLNCVNLGVFSGGQTVTQVVFASQSAGTDAITNCQINNASTTHISADYNLTYTTGQLIDWPQNHTYSQVKWWNSSVDTGTNTLLFSASGSGTQPIGVDCPNTSCGLSIYKAGVPKWQLLADSSGFFEVQDGANHIWMQILQNGTASPGQWVNNGTSNQINFNGNTHNTVLSVGNPAASVTYSVPDAGGNATVGLTLNAGTGVYQSLKGSANGCTTGSSAGNACGTAITITWPGTFSSTSYAAGCSPVGAPTNFPSTPYVVSKSAGSMTVNYVAITAAAASWPAIDCWGIQN
jgi:hypothetical protein